MKDFFLSKVDNWILISFRMGVGVIRPNVALQSIGPGRLRIVLLNSISEMFHYPYSVLTVTTKAINREDMTHLKLEFLFI